MRKLVVFFRNESVLCISFLLALGSMIIIPPDAYYKDYIDYKTLITLFSLMASVAGLRNAGVFSWLAIWICGKIGNVRLLTLSLTLVCFFSSALITNDVALITFVPLAILVLGTQDQRRLIYVIVVQTLAANLGSILFPMGNPQNLLLYRQFSYSIGRFIMEMFPLWILSLCVCIALSLAVPAGNAVLRIQSYRENLQWKDVLCWGVSFAGGAASACGLLPIYWTAAITVLLAIFWKRGKVLFGIDYSLLITFACFFIFVGNITRIESVRIWIQNALSGREILVGAGLSQVISNVPAAAMLAPFTQNARALLYGVNIGGLGTLIASMASLISYRRYCVTEQADKGRYLLYFSVINFALLIIFFFCGGWIIKFL